MKKKAVIFDMDGLLVDTEIISLQIYQILLKPYGHAFTQQEYATHYSGKTEIKNITRLIETYHLPLEINQGLNLVKTIEAKLLAQGVDLKPGVNTLFNYLKTNGFQLALASSSTRERAKMILTSHHLYDDFKVTVFAEDITKSKPDPQIFLKAIDKLKLQPEQCVIFEDSENGIQAAVNGHIDVICIPDMKVPRDDLLALCASVYPTLDHAISFFQTNL